MFARVSLASILIFSMFLFSGCAEKPTDQQKAAVNQAAPVTVEQTPQGSCEAVIAGAASEARATMRIVTKSCESNTIEATPVWSLNYKGSVHIRVLDKNGTQIEDTYVNP